MARRILARNHRRIAEILAGERTIREPEKWPAVEATLNNITYSIADVFAQAGATFDREKFYEIAGLPPLK